MNKVTRIATVKAINILKAVGAKYHIVDADGKTHSNEKRPTRVVFAKQPSIAKNVKKWAREGRSYGDLSKYVKPFLEKMAVGDVVQIPYDRFKRVPISGSVSANVVHMWGKGGAIVARHPKYVEVLRVK